MISQSICYECQSKEALWNCKSHNQPLCSKCTFRNHKNCDKQPIKEQKRVILCQKCRMVAFSIYCQDHQLRLCDICFYSEHKNCMAILEEDLDKMKQIYITSLKETKIPQLQKDCQTKKEEFFKVVDDLTKYLTVTKSSLFDMDKFTEEFINQQLESVEIQVNKHDITSQNLDYIQACFLEQEEIIDKYKQNLLTVGQNILSYMEDFSKAKQNRLISKSFKQNIYFDLNQESDCNYILPSNSSFIYAFSLIYLKESKEFYAVGENDKGQLGNGNDNDQKLPVKITPSFANQRILKISCGQSHSIILTDAGLFSFGRNVEGQLGNGTYVSSSNPVNISNMFDGEKVREISCGIHHNAIITHRNHLFTFGYNNNGQLGNNSNENNNTPINITANILNSNQVSSNVNNSANNNLSNVATQPKNLNEQLQPEFISDVSCGGYHTIILTNKSLYSCGSNGQGQLGTGDQNSSELCLPKNIDKSFKPRTLFRKVTCGAYHTVVQTNMGIYTFGCNQYGQLGNNSNTNSYIPVDITSYFKTDKIVSVNCGYDFTLIQTQNDVYSFGKNDYSQLGDGSNQNKCIPSKITYQFKDLQIKQIQSLGNHTFVETNKGLYGFGRNKAGELLLQELENQPNPKQIDEYLK